jgi:hypothetical protein
MQITAKQLADMAQEIEIGMKVYINRNTYEIRSVMDWEDSNGDTEEWENEEEKILEEWEDFAVVTKMESWEAFRVMEDFMVEVQDERMKKDLIRILEKKRPFANFKAVVESSVLHENWFAYRANAMLEYIKEQLIDEDFKIENGSTSS